MLTALQFAFVDSINLLLIAVIVAVGVMVPRGSGRYAKTTSLLIAGDWCGVAALAFLMLIVFDGLGDVVQRFVEGPVFGILLIATGVVTGVLALRGGDNSGLVNRILAPLRTPSAKTVLVGFVLGLIQSATSVPFYGGLAVLSAAGVDLAVRYTFLVLYATVALSLPTVCALLVGWVRRAPDSPAGRAFAVARENPGKVSLAATWAVALLLIVLGTVHLV
ncbi:MULTISPECIES: hypothetical protein [unclassified Corynebacterium]|uniref:hypothetical protein n=1 Tax=unclassified Corynebacterium TaxID=2624378 RepID=UPI0026532532|nr:MULTISPECIES: hypothetical protein [unclassified Corynebacterium]MDN8595347.1 hypothetical protein [Corynebacterium sp. P4_F2]WKK54831.1 hypothetical protein QYR03_06200 [Corynebacterium sp. P4-C1]WKK64208.1 hypothetical protein QYR04_04820 [Corynebacterium sp. P8-C1]